MIQNLKTVSAGVYRGGRIESAQDSQDLKDMGVRTVLNLQRGWFDWFHKRMNREVIECARIRIVPIHIQMSDFAAPTIDELRAAVKVMSDQFFYNRVFVHCLHGQDRTGMVIAAYRILVDKWTADRAIEEMYACGFHRFPYSLFGWEKQLRKLEAMKGDL